MTLREIATLVGGDVLGNADAAILRVAKIEEASAGEITFLANERYRPYVATTGATAILVAAAVTESELRPHLDRLSFVRVEDPYRAFLRLVDHFFPAPAPLPRGVHPSAIIAPGAIVHADAAVGPYAVVGPQARIGAGAALYPHAVVGEGASVGEGTVLSSHVVVREGCTIGARVIVHAGTVIGSDGFGFAPKPDGTYEKIPQRGIVVVEDDVEIGANCTIDRATIGATRIGRGVKIDNLVQIGHNVVIGDHTVIAGQAGISGSTKIGKHCVIAGQVGFAGHLTIADRTTAGAKSGFSKSIPQSGQTWFGYPAKEAGRSFRIEASLRQLPELLGEVRMLEERIRELERQLHPRQES